MLNCSIQCFLYLKFESYVKVSFTWKKFIGKRTEYIRKTYDIYCLESVKNAYNHHKIPTNIWKDKKILYMDVSIQKAGNILINFILELQKMT